MNYFEGLEVFVNNPIDSLRKMIFHALDSNGDNNISEIDLFALMQSLDNELFVTVASKDVIDLVNFLNQKKKDKNLDDPILNKMKRLEKDSHDLKSKAFRRASGMIDTTRSNDSTASPSHTFKLSAINRIAEVIEK